MPRLSPVLIKCERYPDLAFHVNAGGTRNVALACSKARVPMLYISTDYVFDGEKPAPYVETDPPNPINVYGKSKLEGEKQVSELVDRFWIVRVSWLFGPLGKNFVRTILEQARRGESLRVVDDQMGAPTYTMDVAEMLEKTIERGSPGVYHLTHAPWASGRRTCRSFNSQRPCTQSREAARAGLASPGAIVLPRLTTIAS